MKTNVVKKAAPIFTHEGARAANINAEQQLRRSVMSCLLWEKEFYEDGKSIAEHIKALVSLVKPEVVAGMAIEARTQMNLRHVSLFLARELARVARNKNGTNKPYGSLVSNTIAAVIQRADEIAEFLSLYWKDGKEPLSRQVKRGLAMAFNKFNEFSLAKYNRDGVIKLKDVLFMVHPSPKSMEQQAVWNKLVEGTLEIPDTWETSLSAADGISKYEKWVRLITEKKLGGLAILRNLQNMVEAGVPDGLIKEAIANGNYDHVLPFRFIAAARFAPQYELELESCLFSRLDSMDRLVGRTIILVDVSGSMDAAISAKSDMRRIDAACGMAMILRELCENVSIITFSSRNISIPPRRGFSLRDVIVHSQPHSNTNLGSALEYANNYEHDRIICITDEQADVFQGYGRHLPYPVCEKAYMINVASAKNGVGYGAWTHIDGFSESVIRYITELEKSDCH